MKVSLKVKKSEKDKYCLFYHSYNKYILNIDIYRRSKGEINLKKKLFVLVLSVVLLTGIISGCVEEENKKPTASFTIDPETDIYTKTDIYDGTTITFTDTSEDEDGTIKSWMWDFGDGTNSTESGPIEHSYDEIGEYTVTLMVEDNDGAESDVYTLDIDVTYKDIVDTAVEAGFSTLATALTEAELVDALKEDGPFTVFAPTNAAFAALDEDYLDDLLTNDTENLTKILKYHVVTTKVMSSDLSDGEVATLEGTNITIAIGENVTINDVVVTTPDIECSNGVIHIIGEVLVPESV